MSTHAIFHRGADVRGGWGMSGSQLFSRKVRLSSLHKKDGSSAQLTSILQLMYDLFLFVCLKNKFKKKWTEKLKLQSRPAKSQVHRAWINHTNKV